MADSLYRLPALITSCAHAVASEGRRKCRPAPLAMELLEPLEARAMELLEPLEALTGFFVIKNTFIDTLVPRSPSLAAFYRKRVARSCPPKRAECLLSDVSQEVCDSTNGALLPSPCGTSTPCSLQTPEAQGQPRRPLLGQESMCAVPQVCSAIVAASPIVMTSYTSPTLGDAVPVQQPGATAMFSGLAHGSRIAGAALPPPLLPCLATRPVFVAATAGGASPPPPPPPSGPAPGSLELPSIGSLGHSTGACRPCAFLHTKGCSTGPACKFCHLCEPGERKRRSGEKREMRQQGKAKRLVAAKARAAEVAEGARRERVVSL